MKEQYENQNQLTIDVSSLLVRGVQQEKRDVVEKSFMRNIYFQAAQLVQAVVESDSESSTDRLTFRSEHHNVIAFTGRRGTGKTSAMISFANLLQDAQFLKKSAIDNARFYSLTKHIDASMLTDGDYLLRSIISEMYLDMKNAQERNTDFRDDAMFRKLRSQFIDILHDYNAVSHVFLDHNNAENELEAQTDRLYIKSCMEKLVKDYLACMLKINYREDVNNVYLVVCIDDIDMAKGIQSRIVNDIFLYLMIPNVIVLVTAEFSYLKLALQKDFYQFLEFSEEENSLVENVSTRQALNYLQKIVPSDMRITMPSWKKVDYRELYPCIIDTTNYKMLKRLADCASVPSPKVEPKEFIFFLLAKRTNCLLDLSGHKLHFMEPESLRDLYDKFYLLYNMESLSVKNPNKRAARLINNRKILLDYLYFKMKPELNLSPSEMVFAEELLSLPIERRGKRIWEYYFSCLQNANTSERVMLRFGQNFYLTEVAQEKDRYFCMGEVFRVMFTASRIGIFGKDFVKLLLASYSFNMPQYIESLEHEFVNKSTPPSLENLSRLDRFNEMFGSSLLGQWIRLDNRKDKEIGLSVTIPFDNRGENFKQFDMRMICLFSLLSSNLFNGHERGLTFDFAAQRIIIECMDITALPINLMRLQNDDIRFRLCFGPERDAINLVTTNTDFGSSLTHDEIENRLNKLELPVRIRHYVLSYIKHFNDYVGHLRERMRREPVPMSFMLKHIDMTYNILKRAMIKTYYYSADNPSTYKELPSINADQSFKRFIMQIRELYGEQMNQYGEFNTPEFRYDDRIFIEICEGIDELGYRSDATWEWKDYSTSDTLEGAPA